MFFFGYRKGGKKPKDPHKMTAKEMVTHLNHTLYDEDFSKMIDEEEIDPDKAKKLTFLIEDIVRLDPKFGKLTPDTLRSFKGGIMYGIAVAFKFSRAMADAAEGEIDAANLPPKLKARLQEFNFLFKAIDRNVDNWNDDKWFEELMKNAKIAEEPKKKK